MNLAISPYFRLFSLTLLAVFSWPLLSPAQNLYPNIQGGPMHTAGPNECCHKGRPRVRSNQPNLSSGRHAVTSGLPFLFYPMAGTQSEDFGMVNYVDLDPSGGIRDFNCGPFTYNGHDGSDSSLTSFDEQILGVPIFAAADGLVTASHDGEPDMNTSWLGVVSNYVFIDHGNGLETFYYHMKLGSVLVTPGQYVNAGEMIGMVGSSGNSTGPHLHFSTYLNGNLVEPFAGPCNPITSGWESQPPLPNQAKMLDFAFSRTSLTGLFPPASIPHEGFKLLSDPEIFLWFSLESMPANSTGQTEFFYPNGTLAWDSGVYNFNNPTAYGGSWWWQGWNLFELTTIPGTWTVRMKINGQTMISAPLRVLTSLPQNIGPEAISAQLEPAVPSADRPLICRITSDHLVNDQDFEIVTHRWVWKINGAIVRDITTAARSDMIPASLFANGDQIDCEVTPHDATGPGTPWSTVTVIGSGLPYKGSHEDFIITTGINATATPEPRIKTAQMGDVLVVHFESPLGTYDYQVPVLLAQVFPTGSPPNSPPGYPEIHVDPSPLAPFGVIVAYDGNNAPFPPGILVPGGMTFGYVIPTGFLGNSIMLQAVSLAPSSSNPFLTASDGHEIEIH